MLCSPNRLILKKQARGFFRKCIKGCALGSLSLCLLSTPLVPECAFAASAIDISRGSHQQHQVAINQSRLINLAGKPGRISVGNPDIADLLVLDSGQVYVVAKTLGQTNIHAWDSKDQLLASLNIEVTHDLNLLKRKLYRLLPGETIEVRSSGRDIVLSGEVSDAIVQDSAIRLAQSFAAGTDDDASVISLMSIGGARQVMLEVKVAEVQRNHLKRLGIKFNALTNGGRWSVGGSNGGSSFPNLTTADSGDTIPLIRDGGVWGPPLQQFTPDDITLPGSGLFASLLTGDSLFNLYIDAAKNNNIARILAEPTLTTMSGREAKFIAGGEFPIPVNSGDDQVTIDYKEYGVGLQFLPMVLDSGRINLQLDVNVSDIISYSASSFGFANNSNVLVIPTLTKRSAQSTVELMDGQTIAIAGLVNENLRDVVDKFPGLGDVPVLGYLFRSQEFQKGQTELVIMVTPRLARPLQNPEPSLPTDTFVAPDDRAFYLLGQFQPEVQSATDNPQKRIAHAGAEGEYGHDLGGDY
ncbi:type II and III secretion system protein family protein [Endozoicomonas sp. GU-1]|uniref:type II and III secretion system protein family protein n=1 Tax=Endozoicomonas sp. GU-1 TaxID=3009078 RepID=UPI0022B4219E|nr:type II and III secretion system protein family protein [Endozoicomonas sp. GU-1]WBA79846.1 type II and III secretion system protein family protein [Endozoicomonas sp. GU-1]WBA87421.1 type II and III secretion system protein family protein [Endozoicomonas sp. GU-1]